MHGVTGSTANLVTTSVIFAVLFIIAKACTVLHYDKKKMPLTLTDVLCCDGQESVNIGSRRMMTVSWFGPQIRTESL